MVTFRPLPTLHRPPREGLHFERASGFDGDRSGWRVCVVALNESTTCSGSATGIQAFKINSDGTMTAAGSLISDPNPIATAMDAAGNFSLWRRGHKLTFDRSKCSAVSGYHCTVRYLCVRDCRRWRANRSAGKLHPPNHSFHPPIVAVVATPPFSPESESMGCKTLFAPRRVTVRRRQNFSTPSMRSTTWSGNSRWIRRLAHWENLLG